MFFKRKKRNFGIQPSNRKDALEQGTVLKKVSVQKLSAHYQDIIGIEELDAIKDTEKHVKRHKK